MSAHARRCTHEHVQVSQNQMMVVQSQDFEEAEFEVRAGGMLVSEREVMRTVLYPPLCTLMYIADMCMDMCVDLCVDMRRVGDEDCDACAIFGQGPPQSNLVTWNRHCTRPTLHRTSTTQGHPHSHSVVRQSLGLGAHDGTQDWTLVVLTSGIRSSTDDNVGINMCMDMCTDMYADMYLDICTNTAIDMCIAICVRIGRGSGTGET